MFNRLSEFVPITPMFVIMFIAWVSLISVTISNEESYEKCRSLFSNETCIETLK